MKPIKVHKHLYSSLGHRPKLRIRVQSIHGENLNLACPRATRAMVALMDMQAALGGAASHFGGPSAFAEIMSAMHGFMFHWSEKQNKNWHELFHFVNDAGHCENGLYALKANYHVAGINFQHLRGFRSIDSVLTGHGEAHLFPQGVFISNGPLGSGLPQAQGLAAAESFSQTPRTTVVTISDGACMEGEAKEALASIPGLSGKGKLGPFICMISDNNTKLSGRIDDDCFSMEPTFQSLSPLGWEVTRIEEGHNPERVYQSIERSFQNLLKNHSKPQMLWFKTLKGKGVASMERSSSGGHGFPLKKTDELQSFIEEIYGEEKIPDIISQWIKDLTHSPKPKNSSKKTEDEAVKVQKGVSEALCEMFEKNHPIISISADLQGSTGVAGFRKKHPQASFEVGVAEANMVSLAVGLSKQGFIPVVDTFAQFGVTKGALPLIMSGLSEGPLIAIYSHTGFQDAADGASHQSLTYLSMVSAIPNVDVICLSCASEAKALISQAIENFARIKKDGKTPRSSLFFLGRETYPSCFNKKVKYCYGQAQILADNSPVFDQSVALLAMGPLIEKALVAHRLLALEGIGSVVVNPSIINQPDIKTIKEVLGKTEGRLLTIEDHRLVAGFGAMLSHALSLQAVPFKLKSLGIGDHFGRSAHRADHLYEKFGLGAKDIVKKTIGLIRGE